MTDTAEWRTRAIWDSLEAGSYKQALQLCSKHLKKTPNSPLLQALAALATLKMGKVEEALKLCDSARKLPGALDPSVLPVLAQVYNQAGKRKGVSKMYEEASLAFPRNEELAVLWHMSLARDMNLKEQQQVRV
jgi:N-terminal acetyltransferase B complex non-catalytic subunit